MTETNANLPDQIIRPLKWAAYTVVIVFTFIAIWAVYAPLATTIKANGTLVSSRPNYEIQHPFGGQIKQVNVTAQQTVQKGQTLLLLGTETKRKTLQQIEAQIANLSFENKIISSHLGNTSTTDIPIESPEIYKKHEVLQADLNLKINAITQSVTAQNEQVQLTQDGIDILKKRRHYLQARAVSYEQLIAKGAIAAVQAEAHTDQLLELEGEINDKQTLLHSNQSAISQAQTEIQALKSAHHLSLINQLEQNKSRLPELQRQALLLQDEINQAEIISPIDGSIVSLNFDTEHMYITRGTTLLVLSQPLQHPRVEVVIPANAIDQVKIGIIGKMIIPSLPQRNLPNLNVTLVSVAPEALKDETGQTIGYTAYAEIAPDDLKKLNAILKGKLNLATDMPVSLSLVGNTTTLYDYLIAPFFSAFNGAIQD